MVAARSAPHADGEPGLLYLIKQLELAVRSSLDDLLRTESVTALQYTALTVLEHRPNLTTSQLARNSFVSAQAMADMVTALEERGLVERHRDPADRRRLVLALTSDGRRLLRRTGPSVGRLEATLLDGFTGAQAAAFRQSILRGRRNLAAALTPDKTDFH